jgi:lysylphosphatidylglycerol synthetase-like protein (DUF2156 family)
MNMNRILFISPSTWDKTTWIMTLCVVILFGVISFFTRILIPVAVFFMGLLFIVILLGIICTPYKYILTDTELWIKRHSKNIIIPLQDIKIMRLMTDEDKKRMCRTFGYAGFGYFGTFESAKYRGKYCLSVFARRYTNWTLISVKSKCGKYVIAPNDTGLIDAVNEQMQRMEKTRIM